MKCRLVDGKIKYDIIALHLAIHTIIDPIYNYVTLQCHRPSSPLWVSNRYYLLISHMPPKCDISTDYILLCRPTIKSPYIICIMYCTAQLASC